MRRSVGSGFLALALCAAPLCGYAASAADAAATVDSVWKPVEIRYSYMAFTSAYNCDSAESALKRILLALGAHPQTRVRATGCFMDRPSRNFFITVTTATPVAVGSPDLALSDQSERELLQRLGVKSPISTEQFAARWQTVDLSRDRKLDLKPGDCELMKGLRDNVLPKLSVKVTSDRVNCVPNQLSIQTPELIVSALMPLPAVDKLRPAN